MTNTCNRFKRKRSLNYSEKHSLRNNAIVISGTSHNYKQKPIDWDMNMICFRF